MKMPRAGSGSRTEAQAGQWLASPPAIPACQQAESITGVLLKVEVSARAARQHPTPPSKTKGFVSDKTSPHPSHNEMQRKGGGRTRQVHRSAPRLPRRCSLSHFLTFKRRSQFNCILGLNSLSLQITHFCLQQGLSTDTPEVQLSRSTGGCCNITGARGDQSLLRQPTQVGARPLAAAHAATHGLHLSTGLRSPAAGAPGCAGTESCPPGAGGSSTVTALGSLLRGGLPVTRRGTGWHGRTCCYRDPEASTHGRKVKAKGG